MGSAKKWMWDMSFVQRIVDKELWEARLAAILFNLYKF